jgi:hypothetical protein
VILVSSIEAVSVGISRAAIQLKIFRDKEFT